MRFNLFTGSTVQLRYLILIVAAMVIPALIVGSALYYFIFNVMAEQLAIPEIIAMHLVPVLRKINFMLIIGLIPLFIMLFLWGLLLSHRFFGPLERIEKDLDKILEGNYCIRFKVRKRDDIKSIVDKLNNLLDKLCPNASQNDNTSDGDNR